MGAVTPVSIPCISVIIVGLMINVAVVVIVVVDGSDSLIVEGITVVVSEDRSRSSIHIIIQVFLQG